MNSFPKVSVVNLGCSRNLVDSQAILGRLKEKKYNIISGGSQVVDAVIVNTCCFIEEARRESIDAILDILELKKQGRVKKVILAGCLVQRYGRELLKELKGIDALVGVPVLDKDRVPKETSLTPPHYAYVKICESCYNMCSFCVIPKIKGPFSSRTVESVVAQVRELDRRSGAAAVKEIDLIGQDITAYGLDLYRRKSLARLVREIVKNTRHIKWIRLLYLFPAHVDDELLDLIAGEEKLCKYIDLPLQHISDRILAAMNRNITAHQIKALIGRIRRKIPDAALRTTFIVGFPGETERDFKELMAFAGDVRFEKLGAFMYSREEDTAAFNLRPQVPKRVKRQRYDALMRRQQKISGQIGEKFVGKRLKVLIDEKAKEQENIYLGRTEFDAPEVDGTVYVGSKKKLARGDFAEVLITDSREYDLSGEVK